MNKFLKEIWSQLDKIRISCIIKQEFIIFPPAKFITERQTLSLEEVVKLSFLPLIILYKQKKPHFNLKIHKLKFLFYYNFEVYLIFYYKTINTFIRLFLNVKK